MIGPGLKKLAQTHGMQIGSGVAYGSLMGYATTLCEGSGWKCLAVSTAFADPAQQIQLQKLLSEKELKKTYRVQNWTITMDAIIVYFSDTIGTMKKVEAFIQWFYPLLAQCGARKANVCAQCGGEMEADNWHLVNGIAHNFHESCAQNVAGQLSEAEEERKQADNGSYVQGLVGALLGALLGAVVWALVLYAGYVASLVGLLIGWLANKGYDLLHGRQGKGKVAILIIAVVFGVLVGTLVPDVVYLSQMLSAGELPGCTAMDIPFIIAATLAADGEYLTGTLSNAGMGLLFAALGVFGLLKRTNQEVSGAKFKKLD